MELTKEILAKCMPDATKANIGKYAEPLRKWCNKFKIDTPLRIAHFLAQVGTESGSLRYVRELGGSSYFKKYDTGKLAIALGNTPEADGDGEVYKGRGLIQLTGKANYAAFSKWYFGPGPYEKMFVTHPELVENPTQAVASAVWFWTKNNLNVLADKDDILAVTRRVNGGTNGFADRKNRLDIAKKALGLIK